MRTRFSSFDRNLKMVGTDNPFFPPPKQSQDGNDLLPGQWPSAMKVLNTIDSLEDDASKRLILRGNAEKVLGI